MSGFVPQNGIQRIGSLPTYNGYIDTMLDALLVFEACRLGILEYTKQRPAAADRAKYIRSGSVFIWDENQTGIRRWTDGRRWSSSRPRGNFIIYRELCNSITSQSSDQDEGGDDDSLDKEVSSDHPVAGMSANDQNYVAGNDNINSSRLSIAALDSFASNGISRLYPNAAAPSPSAPLGSALTSSGCLLPIKPGGLTKRALSLTTCDGKRLHLVSYYRPEDVVAGKLRVPSTDPRLAHIRIHANLYNRAAHELEINAQNSWRFVDFEATSSATGPSPTAVDSRFTTYQPTIYHTPPTSSPPSGTTTYNWEETSSRLPPVTSILERDENFENNAHMPPPHRKEHLSTPDQPVSSVYYQPIQAQYGAKGDRISFHDHSHSVACSALQHNHPKWEGYAGPVMNDDRRHYEDEARYHSCVDTSYHPPTYACPPACFAKHEHVYPSEDDWHPPAYNYRGGAQVNTHSACQCGCTMPAYPSYETRWEAEQHRVYESVSDGAHRHQHGAFTTHYYPATPYPIDHHPDSYTGYAHYHTNPSYANHTMPRYTETSEGQSLHRPMYS
jgi:hypothetical protein